MRWTEQPTGRKSDSAPRDTRPGAPKDSTSPKMPPRRTWLWFVLLLLANFVLMRQFMPSPAAPVAVPYTLFKQEVGKGNVQAIYSQGDSLTGRFRAPVTYPPAAATGTAPKSDSPTTAPREAPKPVSSFATTLPSFADPGLEAFLIEHGVEISATPIEEGGSLLTTLLFGFGPTLLLIGLYVWFFRRAAQQGGLGGGLMGIGKSKARRYDQEQGAKVTFDDVAGIDEAKADLEEIVDFLAPPGVHPPGGAAPKGVLLVGAPGTGKTLLAKAVAGEAGVPFFSMCGSEFVEMIVGVGAARVRDLFEQAHEAGPGDHLHRRAGRHRAGAGAMAIGGSSEQEQTLNQILTEMDGFRAGQASSCWRRPTSRTCSTRRCCARGASTAGWWCSARTGPGARRSCGSTPGACRWPPTPAWGPWPPRRPGSRGPSCATWSTRQRCWPPGASRTRSGTRTSWTRWRRSCSAPSARCS